MADIIKIITSIPKWIKKRLRILIHIGFFLLLIGDCSYIIYGFDNYSSPWFIIGAWAFTICVWWYGKANKLFVPARKDYGLSH